MEYFVRLVNFLIKNDFNKDYPFVRKYGKEVVS